MRVLKYSSDLVARPGEKLMCQRTWANGAAIKTGGIVSAYSHACASRDDCTDWEMI